MSPVITKVVAVPANGSSTPLVGDQFEFADRNYFAEFGIVADATGVVMTVYSGSDLLAQEQPVVIRAAGAFPITDQDFYLTDAIAERERLNVLLRNTTGAIINARVVIKLTPI
jgi:hypothetical protein